MSNEPKRLRLDRPMSEPERMWQRYTSKRSRKDPPPFAQDFNRFNEIYAERADEEGPAPAWWPNPEQASSSNLASAIEKQGVADYEAFRRLSAAERGVFWTHTIERLGIRFFEKPTSVLSAPTSPTKPGWLEGARLNIADSCFQAPNEHIAIRIASESAPTIEEISYGELQRLSGRVARALSSQGIVPGESVALYMPMNVECVAAYLGIVRAGARVVSIADSFTAQEVERRAKIADTKLLITQDEYLRAGKPVRLYEKIRNAHRPPAIVVRRQSTPEIDAPDSSWMDWLPEEHAFESHRAAPDEVTNVLFSSGTTGAPKAIPWTHSTPIKAASDGHYHQDAHPDDTLAWPTNIGWMMGPWLIYASLINQATIALYEGVPTGPPFLEFLRDAKVSILGVIPSIVKTWRADGVPKDCLTNIRLFSSTGEPSNKEDYLWLMSQAHYQAPVIEYLGGTEIGGGHLTGSPLRAAAPATFNSPALGLDFVIVSERGRPVAEGQTGELFLVPPSIGLSETLLNKDHDSVYYKNTPAGPSGEQLRRHGDEIARLGRGYYSAQGRADDTMNLGGIKVSSVELEKALNVHSAVYETAAVSVRRGDEGADRLIVFAVLRSEQERDTLKKELQGLLRSELNPLFRISDLVFTEELPRTASNKIMRRRLRDRYRESSDSNA